MLIINLYLKKKKLKSIFKSIFAGNSAKLEFITDYNKSDSINKMRKNNKSLYS